MKLRSWQAEAFPLWWDKQQGIIKVVTGGGKTFFAIHCIKEYLKASPKKDILIVVPSIALLDQWNEALLENGISDISTSFTSLLSLVGPKESERSLAR